MATNRVNGFACGVIALALSSIHSAAAMAQDHPSAAVDANGGAVETSTIDIVVEPMVYHPVEWKAGERVTVGVTFVSDRKSWAIGIATDVELVTIKSYENRYDMTLRSSRETIERITAAAEMSEYWFTVTPFEERHRKIHASEPTIAEFLAKHPGYKPSAGRGWGLNSRAQKFLPRPTEDELPNRENDGEASP